VTQLLSRLRRWFRPPRRLKLTREGKYFIGITFGVGFAAINTGNNLLYLLLGMLLSMIVVSGVLSELSLRSSPWCAVCRRGPKSPGPTWSKSKSSITSVGSLRTQSKWKICARANPPISAVFS